MKRPAPWQARRIATAKALRELPKCAAEGCDRRSVGAVFFGPDANLCPMHQQEAKRAAAPRET